MMQKIIELLLQLADCRQKDGKPKLCATCVINIKEILEEIEHKQSLK